MSISEHERRALESIESDLASTGPKLAAMLTIFVRLTTGEEMPAREQVRRPCGVPGAAAMPGAAQAGRLTGPRGIRRTLLRKQPVWLVWLAWPAVAITLITWALIFAHGAGGPACPVARTAACQQAPASAGPGSGEQHREQPPGGRLSPVTAGIP